jgi:hypothetical protein
MEATRIRPAKLRQAAATHDKATRTTGQVIDKLRAEQQPGRAAPAGLSLEADTKLSQLRSLLKCCYGVGAEWMEVIGTGHRDTILWIASDLAEDLAKQLGVE